MTFKLDSERDLLYVYFSDADVKAAKTITITPGVHADFDAGEKLIGIEVIDASKVLGGKIEFKLPETITPAA